MAYSVSFGFNEADLVRYGVFAQPGTLVSPREPSLANAIHGLFDRSHWLGCRPEQWTFDNSVMCVREIIAAKDARPPLPAPAPAPTPGRPRYFDEAERQRLLVELDRLRYTEGADYQTVESWVAANVGWPPNPVAHYAFLRDEDLRKRNWEPFDADLYKRLQPTLRLASRLLDLAMPLLWTIYNAALQPTQEPVARKPGDHLAAFHSIFDPNHPAPTATDLQQFSAALATTLASRIVFQSAEEHGVFGATDLHGDAATPDRHIIAVTVDDKTIDAAVPGGAYVAELSRPHRLARQACMLHCAITLAHEVAHAALMLRADYDALGEPEPYFDAVQMSGVGPRPELGEALETWLFGGNVEIIEGDKVVWDMFRDGGGLKWVPEWTAEQGYDVSSWAVRQAALGVFLSGDAWAEHEVGKGPLVLELTACKARTGQLVGQWFYEALFERTLDERAVGGWWP